MEYIEGGVTAAEGFSASGLHCGIRKNKTKPDLALIFSDRESSAGAVYTQNLVKGAPIAVTKENIADGKARAIICNSGIANTCAPDGIEKAREMCAIAAQVLGLLPTDIVVASTGVIGPSLPTEPIRIAAPALKDALSPTGSLMAATAIMTTDTFPKEAAVMVGIGGKKVKIGGIAKGSGMIHPNMATMLSFMTSDCAISPEMLQKAIKQAADRTYNMISVDGDTSTNDTFLVLANGAAGNPEISAEGADFETFAAGLEAVARKLAKMLARDGEGATKLLTVRVEGAPDLDTARTVARSVSASSLFKSAMFGNDANPGRILCAIGYAGVYVDVDKIDVTFRSVKGQEMVCQAGMVMDFSEEHALEVISQPEVETLIDLHMRAISAEAYGCDLTYDYVKINADYRS
ncbi:bifunctional glutamate N-acetyltransferase/amino-acid acetyltransferase ArgJ [Acutalibacter caecimuris]|uniref:bifunctional glutamate N-acetyltransferase/amino-acid acetyltransferase ArgJ n=1 Tax=Acutalibacter caecimuris TaxID=3093657 RepID=UPI002AC9CBD4|nr:bifunctional glutamate N-acetyltransferase/amino-acid acetyltransferase ArgJ [Acutalibacter sp. M00118]